MLPPDHRFSKLGCGLGWSRLPGAFAESSGSLAESSATASERSIDGDPPPLHGEETLRGQTLDVVAVEDLLELTLPSLDASAASAEEALPTDVPALLERLSQRVGGLDDELATLVRRTLASRLHSATLSAELGLPPVRGMLLYGPPGCGKTLLAREIASALGARRPKVVNGPEMMSKYVGDSEAFVRALFVEAEAEQSERGDDSELHVIVLDEMDAFTRSRGSLGGDASGVRDSVVNQLLAKMDGVTPLNNILVIGLTNRKELIDPAILRPGRLEVHIEVLAPDREGRQQILEIHARRLLSLGCLEARAAAAVRSGALARVSEGFSGADLAGLVRSAASFALERYIDKAVADGWADAIESVEGGREGIIQVTHKDLEGALRETQPTARGLVFGGRAPILRRVGRWWRTRRLRALTASATSRVVDSDLYCKCT